MSWSDGGSVDFNCNPLGRADCIAGCPPLSQWHSGLERWGSDELAEMLAQQDQHQLQGPCVKTRPAPECSSAWKFRLSYNEVVLDKWRHHWEPELAELVDAVFVSPRASEAALELAHAVHAAINRRLAASVPLLSYDAEALAEPFQALPTRALGRAEVRKAVRAR